MSFAKQCVYGTGSAGSWAGAQLGSILGAGIQYALTGSGDYTVTNDIVKAGGTGPMVPTFAPGNSNEIVITNKEYLGPVRVGTAGAFTTETYLVNPANWKSFPWLGPIAQQYEEWRAYGIAFIFISSATDNVATASVGNVMMGQQYRNDPLFINKTELMNSAMAQECRSSDNLWAGIECDPKQNIHDIRYTTTSDTSTTDWSDLNLCQFTVATQGSNFAAGSEIGSLYIIYKIGLMKMQLWNGIPNRGPRFFRGTITSYTDASPLGTAAFVQTGGNLLGMVGAPTLQAIRLPHTMIGAVFLVLVRWQGTGAVVAVQPVLTATGATIVMGPINSPPTGVTNTGVCTSFYFVQVTGGPTVQVAYGAAGTLPTTPVAGGSTIDFWQISDLWNVNY